MQVPRIDPKEHQLQIELSDGEELSYSIEDLKKKEELLNEIQNIRKSLEVLKAETPAPSTSSDSRHPSFSSRRTLSHDLGSFPSAGPSHLRPQVAKDARSRSHSMDLLGIRESIGNAIGRPTSVPLRQDDEDRLCATSHVDER